MTFKRSLGLRFYKAGESSTGKCALGTLITGIVGWWGIPWGPIYSIGAIISNLRGGKDSTKEILSAVIGEPQTQSLLAQRPKPKADAGMWALRAAVIAIPALLIFSIMVAAESGRRVREERLANDPGYAAFQKAEDSLDSFASNGNSTEAKQVARVVSTMIHVMVDASLEDDDARQTNAYCRLSADQGIVTVKVRDLRQFNDEAKGEILDSVWEIASPQLSAHLPEKSDLTVALKGIALWEGALTGSSGDPNSDEPLKYRRRVERRSVDDLLSSVFDASVSELSKPTKQ